MAITMLLPHYSYQLRNETSRDLFQSIWFPLKMQKKELEFENLFLFIYFFGKDRFTCSFTAYSCNHYYYLVISSFQLEIRVQFRLKADFEVSMSQNFELTQPDDLKQYQQWVPQISTNQYNPPHILSYSPFEGQEGDTYRIDVKAQDMDYSKMRIAFGSCITPTQISDNHVTQILTIQSIVPNPTLISNPSSDYTRIPIYLVVIEKNNNSHIVDSWFISYFSYSRKRMSNEFIEERYVAKRARSIPDIQQQQQQQQQQADQSESFLVSNYSTGYYGMPHHMPYVGLPPTEPPNRPRDFFEDPQSQMLGYPTYKPPDTNTYQYGNTFIPSSTTTGNTNAPIITSNTPQGTGSPYIMPMVNPVISPQSSHPSILPLTPLQLRSNLPQNPSPTPSSSTANPPLNYASNINPAASTSVPSSTEAGPFVNLLNKANLTVEGNLEEMIKDWTDEEWKNQRRLVQFWRRQQGNEVTCRFEPYYLPEKSKQANLSKMIIVSCIYWKEKNDYFITSVDCIYLLESLIGVKFTVEEKNRIRRNLEGFKPLTVSKLKSDSADFFKVIMGFPNPKPRNIEKDVKVFSWSILDTALKKIISKYTASYSSTASVDYDVLTATTAETSSPST
ncbi:hypothetical protein BDB01DRAFT_833065 [Pilobolus umbonatus]|nr:hypothetical protein BDB01DRAFT_833065 [Pilobolus umbonatus]